MNERYSYPFHAPKEAVLMEESDCIATVKKARREERERIAKATSELGNMDHIAAFIRELPEEAHDE